MTGLTEQGRELVRAFNRAYVYAQCKLCGVLASPPRDGYPYRCARSTCNGALVEIDPAGLRAEPEL